MLNLRIKEVRLIKKDLIFNKTYVCENGNITDNSKQLMKKQN